MTDAEYEKLYYCTHCRSISEQDGACRCGTELVFAGTPTVREQIVEGERRAATRRRMRWEGSCAVLIGGAGIAVTVWLYAALGSR